MTKSSALSIVVMVVIHLVNGALFLNATGVGLLCDVVMISPLTKKFRNHRD